MKKITSEVSSKKQEYGDLIVTVHDKYGNLMQKVEQTVDSFVDQYWIMNRLNFTVLPTATFVSLTNANNTLGPILWGYKFDANANGYAGIVVGTGSNPTTISKKILDTLILHGQGNNELSAQSSTVEWDQTTGIATLTRPFVNLSANAATITVAEVAIAMGASENAGAGSAFMLVRDVLQSSLNVPFEATLAVQYKVRLFNGNNNYRNIFIRPFGLSTTATAEQISGVVNTTGSLITASTAASIRIISPEGILRRGLVLGTSNTAFNVSQINLNTRINHGNNAGELFYHSTTNSNLFINTSSNSLFFQFYRSVENRSGSNISISEIGVFTDIGSSTQSYMIDRRVIDPPVVITNGNIISFTWEFCYEV
jgi:hypothetical protein